MVASERFNMVLPRWLKDAIKECADRSGVSMSEYVKDALKSAVTADREKRERGTDGRDEAR